MKELDDLAIRVEGLSFGFRGRVALRDLSFSVRRQTIHGFVGPNGAGKTTTLRILATVLKSARGVVEVLGMGARARWRRIRRCIGYLPDHFGMYEQLTVREYLDFFAAAYGLAEAARMKAIREVLALIDMAERREDPIHSLSRGMRQRISLGRVLVHDPQLLLLDEPASGLDPRARSELMDVLRELRRLGKTILISSHILGDVAELCDDVTIIDCGATRFSGRMAALLDGQGDQDIYLVELAAPNADVEGGLRELPWVRGVELHEGGTHYKIACRRAAEHGNRILEAVLRLGGRIVGFGLDRRHIDDAFLELTGPGVR